jgi:hypothetical protein
VTDEKTCADDRRIPPASKNLSTLTPSTNPASKIAVPARRTPATDDSPNGVTNACTERAQKSQIFDDIDEPDVTADNQGVESTGASNGQLIPESEIKVSHDLTLEVPLLKAQNGQPFFVLPGPGNPRCFLVGSRQGNNLLRQRARRKGRVLTRRDISDLNDNLQSVVEMEGASGEVSYRVAPIPGGIVIDLGDDKNIHAQITPGRVELIKDGSPTLFYRTPISRPMVQPAGHGNLDLLDKYLNLDAADIVLLKAWLSYTLAHPKRSTTKYPILVPQGEQGSGKTLLCYVIQTLIDPNTIGVQILPNNAKDLAIAAQNSHVLAYDNVRGFKQAIADLLCIASTGGALSSRQLYSDADQAVQRLHVALILNGIHDFINQPDLAQRCLPLHLKPLAPKDRRSEEDFVREFETDLPAILRGLFDLIAEVFVHLPSVEVSNPERMIDYTRWLAAMEKAQGIEGTPYQNTYSDALRQVQRETLLDSPLAAAVLTFAEGMDNRKWSGTPSDFLEELNTSAAPGSENWKYWPRNPIALSKRLKPLLGGLRDQGIDIQTTRGKQRQITITLMEGFRHD